MKTKKIVDRLTEDGVCILTQKFVEDDGKMLQVGENHRRAYTNSITGRVEITENEPEDVVNAVMTMWGDEPTVVESEPTTE